MRALALLPVFLAAASLAQTPAPYTPAPSTPAPSTPVPSAPAQASSQPSAQGRDNPFLLHSTSSLVLIPAQIQTRHGDMLYGLKKEHVTCP